jgi:glycosyltransferase involved in cell wall biosynthesis
LNGEHRPRVLFVAHDASRSGAPVLLLRLLRWLVTQDAVEVHILLLRGGPLLADFEKVSRTCVVWNDDSRKLFQAISLGFQVLSGREKPSLRQRLLLRHLKSNNFDLIYANTAVVCDKIPLFKEVLGCPVIWHIHELASMIRAAAGNAFEDAANCVEKIIAVSEFSKRQLVQEFNIDQSRVEVVYPFIDPLELRLPASDVQDDIKDGAGLGNCDFVVGGCGYLNIQKAPELFVLVAAEVKKRSPALNCRFVWLGGVLDSMETQVLIAEAARLGVADRVIFLGEKATPYDYFSAFDVFLLTSREESFGLVVLESAFLRTPAICFRNVSGIDEFVGSEAGLLCTYPEVACMADQIIRLAEDRELLERLADNVARRSLEFTTDVCAQRILKIMTEAVRCQGV